MRRPRAARFCLTSAARLVLFLQDVVWSVGQHFGTRVADWRVLAPARQWVASRSAMAALPLFLVPEICSRVGTLAAAWLLLQGDVWRALAVYVATKLFAGMTALWIYTACLPALMQVRAFAAVHDAVGRLRLAVVESMRSRLPQAGSRTPNQPLIPP